MQKKRTYNENPEHCDKEGSARLVARLTRYWHEAGFATVRFWCSSIPFRKGTLFCIHSNLVNGLPPAKALPEGRNLAMQRIVEAAHRERLREFTVLGRSRAPQMMPVREAA